MSRGDTPAGDRGHRAESREDPKLIEAPKCAEMAERGADPATGATESDAVPPGWATCGVTLLPGIEVMMPTPAQWPHPGRI